MGLRDRITAPTLESAATPATSATHRPHAPTSSVSTGQSVANVAAVAEGSPPLAPDLRDGILRMARRWGYSGNEIQYALTKAMEDPIGWWDFVDDDERWCATRH